MPKKVSQLGLKNRRDLTNNYQVVVTDPTDYTLYRVSVPQFRGASVFVSENEPTLTPEDPLLTEYIDGDVFIHETADGLNYFSWDNINSVWASQTKLNGLRVLTATDFPDEIQLDLRETNFITDKAFANDYYLNKTIDILFAYSSVNGFQFGTTTFEGYEGFRAPTAFYLQGNDVDGYENIPSYVGQYVAGTLGSLNDIQKRQLRLPIHNDTFHLLLENDEGHGGWLWRFDANNPVDPANTSNWVLALSDKLGLDWGGDVTATRLHAREAKTWNDVSAPVQNDKKYRQGDNVFVTTAGVIYYNYQEGLPDGTTDLATLFEGQTILAGSSLKTAQDGAGDWVSPTTNDSVYKEGDYILAKDLGTPRIHGPYSFGAASDLEAWPLYAVLRSPVEHRFDFDPAEVSGFNLPTTFLGDYPTAASGEMIVEGDHALLYYSTVKGYTTLEGVTVDLDPTNKTLDWGDLNNRAGVHPVTIKVSASLAEPSIDLTLYYNEQIVRNAIGDLYRFNEDFDDHANSSFEQLLGLRANVIHLADSTTIAGLSYDYAPDTNNNSDDWGNSTVQDGDTLEVKLSDNRIKIYTATVNEATNVIVWGDEREKFELKEVRLADNTLPVNDNMNYRSGDKLWTGEQVFYVYDETINSGVIDTTLHGGWVFQYVDRPNILLTFPVNDVNGNVDLLTSVQPDTRQVNIPTLGIYTVKVGDSFAGSVATSTTGKSFRWVVTDDSGTYVTLYKENPKPVVFHVTNEIGRPNANDADYSTGDFIDSPVTGWRYGPYVEQAPDNATAWPDFVKLTQTTQYTDKTTSVIHEIEVDNGEFYFLEK
ncbi:conserved hypothetical protein [Vibrio phage 501E54-1]|nr:conserved hypothetical protein [Vibrio phage 501E54-1]